MPLASLLATSLLGAVTNTMEYGDTDEEDMRDLDTVDDSTDKRDNIDCGVTPAKTRPRKMPKMHRQNFFFVCIRIWASQRCDTLFILELSVQRAARRDMEKWRKICVNADNLKTDYIYDLGYT